MVNKIFKKIFGAKFDKWASVMKLDKHHSIERWGVLFSILAVTFSLVTVGAWNSASTYKQSQLDTISLYTRDFTTSRTQLTGSVDGVYVNKDRTSVFVMMHFATPTKVATDANTYQAFLTGATPDFRQQSLDKNVKGKIVTFGSTGYIGVLLTSGTPFEQQILNLTIRANDELVYTPQDERRVSEDMKNDASFAEYDQWRVYFNPGVKALAQKVNPIEADTTTVEGDTVEETQTNVSTKTLDGVRVIKALDTPNLDVGKLYAEVVTQDKESKIRGELYNTLGKLRADLATIDSYETELGHTKTADGDFLVPIRGDKPQPSVVSIAGDVIIDRKTGESAKPTTPVRDLDLKTSWVSPNGYNFDWRKGSVVDGYLNELVPVGQKYGDFLTAKARAKSPEALQASQIQWKLTDGVPLTEAVQNRSKTVLEPLLRLQTNLENAYSVYYQDKEVYQVKYPTELLELEVTLHNVESTYSVTDSKKTLVVY